MDAPGENLKGADVLTLAKSIFNMIGFRINAASLILNRTSSIHLYPILL